MPDRLVGAGDPELAVLELDVGFGRLHQVGRDLLALVDDLVAGVDHGLAADRQRARAVGAHADRGLVGVAVDDVDVLVGHAQLLGDHLRQGGLVALAVAVGAGHHLHLAGVGEADLRALPQADAGAERAHHRRGGDAAGLDVAGEADAAQLAAPLGLGLARREAGIVGELQRLVERRLVVADVVHQRHGRLVGEGVLRDEVLAAELGRVLAQLVRRLVHQVSSRNDASGRPAPR